MFFSFLKVSIIVCSVQAVINASSAYAELCFKHVDVLPLSSSCFKITLITILNLYDGIVCGIFGSILLPVEIVYCQNIFQGGEMEYVQSLDLINV